MAKNISCTECYGKTLVSSSISWLAVLKASQEMCRELIAELSLLDTPSSHKPRRELEVTEIQ